MPGTRKLGREASHRKAMLRSMVTSLLEKGKMKTTLCRAKEVRSLTEKMITLAKESDLHRKRQVFAFITKESVVKNLFDTVAPMYRDIDGGYTRITKLGPRRGDCAEMAIIELVSLNKPEIKEEKKARGGRRKKQETVREPKVEENVNNKQEATDVQPEPEPEVKEEVVEPEVVEEQPIEVETTEEKDQESEQG